MIRRPPRSTLDRSSAASDVYKRQAEGVTLTQFRATPRPTTPVGGGDLIVYVGASSDGERQALATISLIKTPDRPLTRNPVDRPLFDSLETNLIGYDWDHTLDGRKRLYLHWASDLLEGYWTTAVDDAAIAALALPPYRGPWGVPVREWRFPRGQDGGHYVPLGQGIVWTGGTLNGQAVSYTHLRAHETVLDLVCRLLLEKKKQTTRQAQD